MVRAVRCVSVCIALAGLATPGWALHPRASFEDIVHTAHLVFIGTVVDTTCWPDGERPMIYTDVLFDDIEIVSAGKESQQHRSASIRLTYSGGQWSDIRIDMSGTPRFEPGQRYLLFVLDDGKRYINPVVGGPQGLFEVVSDSEIDQQYVLTAGGRAVVDVGPENVTASRVRVAGIETGRVVASADLDHQRAGMSVHRSGDVDPSLVTLPSFVQRILKIRTTPRKGTSVFKLDDSPGRYVFQKDGEIVSEPLPHKRGEVGPAGRLAELAKMLPADHADRSSSPRSSELLENKGSPIGYCGWQDLLIDMEQVPTSWWSWSINVVSMSQWDRYMNIFKSHADDGMFSAANLESEFCGFVNDTTLFLVYGSHWGGALAVAFTITLPAWCDCCEITESDIAWNSALTWTSNPDVSIGNPGVYLLLPINVHELGHAWGLQRKNETYDYDHVTVMHAYSSSIVEDGLGIHYPDAALARELYDSQTSVISVVDVGVESYYASDGLHNTWISTSSSCTAGPLPSVFYPGDDFTVCGLTLENISPPAWFPQLVSYRFYLSPDRQITESDIQFYGSHGWYAHNSVMVLDHTLTVPTTAAPGTYYVGVIATIENDPTDSFPPNNSTSLFSPVTIGPATPQNVSASDGTYTDRVRVSWSPVLGAGEYWLFRRTCPTCSLAAIGTTGANFYDDVGAVQACGYEYLVASVTPDGKSSRLSSPDSGYRGFETPANLTASDDEVENVHLSWDAVPGASSYEVRRSTCNDSFCFYFLVGEPGTPSFDDVTATPRKRYYYFVRAKNHCGSSPASQTVLGMALSGDIFDDGFESGSAGEWSAVVGQ